MSNSTYRRTIIVVVAMLALVAGAEAQRRRGFGGYNLRVATPDAFDGAFQFCRLAFRENRYGDGGGWGVDYPRADINLSIRLSELTLTRVSMDPTGEPNHLIVQPLDESLFSCPFVMMTEVGAAYLDDEEAARLRAYVLKGGFIWADDFWGSNAWELWANELAKVLPPTQFPIQDLPLEHPIFRSMFEIKKVPQIPSINHWMGSGGGTSERYSDSATPHMRGIFDRKGRLMVLITHNTDVGDSWEREADDPQYFYNFSVDGYALGINITVYAMSH